MSICRVCSSEDVNTLSDIIDVNYNRKVLHINIQYSMCNVCGREFISSEQVKQNDFAVRNAKIFCDEAYYENK